MNERSIESLKREAKKLKKLEGLTHSQALDKLAARYGFSNWSCLMRAWSVLA